MSLITHLRPARIQDCQDIYQAHRYAVRFICVRSYNEAILSVWQTLLNPESYLDTINLEHKELWVAEYNGNVQGFFQLDLQEALLDALYVHPFVHNQGLGTALLYRAEQLAEKANLSILRTYASENSVSFYKLNGYESLGKAMMPLNATTAVPCQLMRKYL